MWRRMSYVGAFLVLVSAGLVQAHYVGPTREGLSFYVSAVPSDIYLPNDVLSNEVGEDLFPTVSTLTVRVRDMDQRPIKGVPVTFDTAPGCESVATLTPDRAVTSEDGVAHATVESDNTTGICQITVQVDNVSQMTRVTVFPAPEAPSAGEGVGVEKNR
jgi:hypothetical protein